MDRLVFIGFMGAGKSAVGRAVARAAAWKFFDTDTISLALSGLDSINEIFDNYGETYFRDLEMRAAQALEKESQAVISTGGGVVMNEELMRVLKTPSTITVYIQVSFEKLQARLNGNLTRPLMRDVIRARSLYDSRLEYYQRYADIIFDNDSYTPSEASDKMLEILKERNFL